MVGSTRHCMVFTKQSAEASVSKAQLMSLKFSTIIQEVFQLYTLELFSYNSHVAMKAQNWSWNKTTHYLPQWLLPQSSHSLYQTLTKLLLFPTSYTTHPYLLPPAYLLLLPWMQFMLSHFWKVLLQSLGREGDSAKLLPGVKWSSFLHSPMPPGRLAPPASIVLSGTSSLPN